MVRREERRPRYDASGFAQGRHASRMQSESRLHVIQITFLRALAKKSSNPDNAGFNSPGDDDASQDKSKVGRNTGRRSSATVRKRSKVLRRRGRQSSHRHGRVILHRPCEPGSARTSLSAAMSHARKQTTLTSEKHLPAARE